MRVKRTFSDLLGMLVSGICAIQCALAPILLSLLPALPKWAHFGHGWLWIAFIGLLAGWSIGRSYCRHRRKSVLAVAIAGYSLLVLGTVLEGHLNTWQESLVFATGGLLLAWAHWRNYRLDCACRLPAAKPPGDTRRSSA
jgi:hypothetical protein